MRKSYEVIKGNLLPNHEGDLVLTHEGDKVPSPKGNIVLNPQGDPLVDYVLSFDFEVDTVLFLWVNKEPIIP